MDSTHPTHLSLTVIYHSLKDPNSPNASQCRVDLASASVKVMDHTLRKWHHYAKGDHKKWSITRLIRCLDYMLTYGIKPSQHREAILTLDSFQSCLKWILHRLPEQDKDAVQLHSQVKFLSNLLEATDREPIVKLFRDLEGVEYLLSLACSDNSTSAIRFYCIRGLTAIRQFTENLLVLHAPERLASLLNRLISAEETEQAVMVSRLLDQITIPKNNDYYYADKDNSWRELVYLWITLGDRYRDCVVHKRDGLFKSQASLVYSLTNIIYKCASASSQARMELTEPAIQHKWFSLLVFLSQRWCHQRIFIEPDSSTMLPQEERTMLKLLNVTLIIVNVLPQRQWYTIIVKNTVNLLTCFFMAFLCQGVLAERDVFLQWLDYQLCIEVDERGSAVDLETLDKHQRLLVFLLDIYIQYIQLFPNEGRRNLAPSLSGIITWCLKSFLLLLQSHDRLEESPLLPRLKKLVVFYLHNDKAIEVLASSPKTISQYIWLPTIDLAREGLVMIAGLTEEELSEINVKESTTLYKADRAFVSLELIAKVNARACERLVECNVLDLITFITAGLQWAPSLLTLYARFVRLMATLAGRSAFIRVRLRDESALFSKIKGLLNTAVLYRQQERDTAGPYSNMEGCYKLIKGCLLVITSFQYDEPSMRQWLSSNDDEVSAVSLILPIVFPWMERPHIRIADMQDIYSYLRTDEDLMALASYLLEHASSHPLCVRQVIEHELALPNLCKVTIDLLPRCSESQGIQDEKPDIMMEMNDDNDDNDDLKEPEEAKPVPGEPSSSEKPLLMSHYALSIQGTSLRILEPRNNIRVPILSNAYTLYFQAVIQRPRLRGDHYKSICSHLYKHRMEDFQKLYRFAQTEDDSALKLHEMTAVAIGYAAIGASSAVEWNASLGLTGDDDNTNDDLSRHAFGALCQMLVYNLEYEHDQENTSRLDTVITPLRRNAAAQVLEILALEFASLWSAQTVVAKDQGSFVFQSTKFIEEDMVMFVTDDGQKVIGNRALLRSVSPIFSALLSKDYVESEMSLIPLHDVTFHSLQGLIEIIHRMNAGEVDILDVNYPWTSVVAMLKISDRFGCMVVKGICENWVATKVKEMELKVEEERKQCLEGLLGLYRECRDPIERDGGITSNTWPFSTVLKESLKTVTQYLTETCQTKEFIKMVQGKNMDELESFCNGIAILLRKAE
jgi:hypothetical protein